MNITHKVSNPFAKKVAAISVFSLFFALTYSVSSVSAATYTVNEESDSSDGACVADGIETEEEVTCTLRQAINAANSDGEASTIELAKGDYVLSEMDHDGIGLTEPERGDLDITDPHGLTIIGADRHRTTILRGADFTDRFFEVHAGAGSDTRDPGFRLEGVTLDGSSEDEFAFAGNGAGISIEGTRRVDFSDCMIRNFSANGNGAGVYIAGVGDSLVSVDFEGCTLQLNYTSLGNGGSLYVSGENTTVSIMTSEIIASLANNGGGAYFHEGSFSLKQSLIYFNEAHMNGGGFYADELSDPDELSNNTVGENIARHGSGGGIFTDSGTTIELVAHTIVGNGANVSGGGLYAGDGDIETKMTVVADNGDDNCATSTGTISSGGYSADSGESCGFTDLENGDMSNVDAGLELELELNGGPTRTYAFDLSRSPEELPLVNVIAEGSPVLDQRGQNRPGASFGLEEEDRKSDIGAYELIDADNDRFADEDDADDTDPNTYPGAPEIADGKDNNGNGVIDEETDVFDDDRDGFSEDAGDCNDTDESIYPGAVEVYYDGVDQNCDGKNDFDADGDGYTRDIDPNDNDASVIPSKTSEQPREEQAEAASEDLGELQSVEKAAAGTVNLVYENGTVAVKAFPKAKKKPADAVFAKKANAVFAVNKSGRKLAFIDPETGELKQRVKLKKSKKKRPKSFIRVRRTPTLKAGKKIKRLPTVFVYSGSGNKARLAAVRFNKNKRKLMKKKSSAKIVEGLKPKKKPRMFKRKMRVGTKNGPVDLRLGKKQRLVLVGQ